MNTTTKFLTPSDHYNALVQALPRQQFSVYQTLRHAREELAFAGRQFVVYKMNGNDPEILTHLKVLDFQANDAAGATTEVLDSSTGKTYVVDHSPQQIGEHPVFLALSLRLKLRWDLTDAIPSEPSLGFPILIRTKSRLQMTDGNRTWYNLREQGVVYCETGPNFAREFDKVDAD